MKFVGRLLNGTCSHMPPSGNAPAPRPVPASSTATTFTLKASVGRGGVNNPEDVIAVQSALIQAGPANGGQSPAFPLDGRPSSQLNEAIQKFQIQHFGWSKADSLVEPNRQTHQKLNEFTGKPVAPALTGKVSVVLQYSVGQGGRNEAADVLQIQSALIQVGPAQGGTSPHAPLDGYCTPKLIEAIRRFQLKHFGWAGADGLITPYQQTHIKLNSLLNPGPAPLLGSAPTNSTSIVGVSIDDHKLIVVDALQRAQRWILAAQANCSSALIAESMPKPATSSPFPSLSPKSRLQLLEKHFGLGTGKLRMEAIRHIAKTYDRMAMTLQRPGGLWGSEMVERDPTNNSGCIAFTYLGGFFLKGQKTKSSGKELRMDAIYLCQKFYEGFHSPNQRAFVMIHELAHFVGHPQGINDFAYNHEADKMKSLSSWQRRHNADSYVNFAWECLRGSGASTEELNPVIIL